MRSGERGLAPAAQLPHGPRELRGISLCCRSKAHVVTGERDAARETGGENLEMMPMVRRVCAPGRVSHIRPDVDPWGSAVRAPPPRLSRRMAWFHMGTVSAVLVPEQR